MDNKNFPPVGQELIDRLIDRFDVGPPTGSEDLPKLYLRAGWAEVIGYLQQVSTKQSTGMSNQESNNVLLQPEDTRPTSSSGRTPRRRTRRS